MANQAIIFGLVGAGGLLLTAAVTDSSISQTLQGHANKVSGTSSLDTFLGGLKGGQGLVGPSGAVVGKTLASNVGSTKYTGPASVLNSNQQKFAATFAKATGLSIVTVAAWLINEEPASSTAAPNGANNWLNVDSTDSGFFGGGNPAWTDPVSAANFTAQWLAANQPSILASVKQGPVAQAQAIQNSGWASSHYGYSKIVDDVNSFLKGGG